MSDPRMCIVCGRTELDTTERQTCVRCLSRTRSALAEIVEKYDELPAELTGHIGAARPIDAVGQADSDGVPEALVLLAGGSNGTVTASRNGDRSHAADHWRADPPSVVAVLAWWEDDWRGPNVAQQDATVVTCAGYLTEHLSWAAQNHPAFDEFASDIRKLRGQVVAAIRDGEPVDRGKRIPCPDCGQPLIRRYREARRCKHPTPERDFRADCAIKVWDGDGKVIGYRCGHQRHDPEHWDGGYEPYELYRKRLDHHWEIHTSHDQGGRTDDWICPNCRRVVDDRQYWFAVAAHEQVRKLAS